MSKGPTDSALAYTPADPEVYERGYRLAERYATDPDDAALLMAMLYEDHGRKPRAPKRASRTTPEQRQAMLTRWRKGELMADIARDYGIGRSTVHGHIVNLCTDHEREELRRKPAECGTEAGYRTHLRNGEQACEECRVTHNERNEGQKRRAELRYRR
jgi:hypothetical protein